MFLTTFTPFAITGGDSLLMDTGALRQAAREARLLLDKGSSYVEAECASQHVKKGDTIEDLGPVEQFPNGFAIRVNYVGIKVDRAKVEAAVELWEKEIHIPAEKRHASTEERSAARIEILKLWLKESRAARSEDVFEGEVGAVVATGERLCFIGAQSGTKMHVAETMVGTLINSCSVSGQEWTLSRQFTASTLSAMLRTWLLDGKAPFPFTLGRTWTLATGSSSKVAYKDFNLDLDAVTRYLTKENCRVLVGSLITDCQPGETTLTVSVNTGGFIAEFSLSGPLDDGSTVSFTACAVPFVLGLSTAMEHFFASSGGALSEEAQEEAS